MTEALLVFSLFLFPKPSLFKQREAPHVRSTENVSLIQRNSSVDYIAPCHGSLTSFIFRLFGSFQGHSHSAFSKSSHSTKHNQIGKCFQMEQHRDKR